MTKEYKPGDLTYIKSTIRYGEPADRTIFTIRKFDDRYEVKEMPEKEGVSIRHRITSRSIDPSNEADLIYMSGTNKLLRNGLSQSERERPFQEFDEKTGKVMFSEDGTIIVNFLDKDPSTDILLKADLLLEELNNKKIR